MTAKELIFKEISEKIRIRLERELSKKEIVMIDRISTRHAFDFSELIYDEVNELCILLNKKG